MFPQSLVPAPRGIPLRSSLAWHTKRKSRKHESNSPQNAVMKSQTLASSTLPQTSMWIWSLWTSCCPHIPSIPRIRAKPWIENYTHHLDILLIHYPQLYMNITRPSQCLEYFTRTGSIPWSKLPNLGCDSWTLILPLESGPRSHHPIIRTTVVL